jgi:hypothetical protein
MPTTVSRESSPSPKPSIDPTWSIFGFNSPRATCTLTMNSPCGHLLPM